jgi:hypothetical protein
MDRIALPQIGAFIDQAAMPECAALCDASCLELAIRRGVAVVPRERR